MKRIKPLLRGHSHQAMFFIAVGACTLFIAKVNSDTKLLAVSIYSTCLMLMFGISALYHRIFWSEEKRAIMRKLDHCAIFLMIAGSVTPMALVVLGGESGRELLILIWVAALIGILQSVFFSKLPRVLSTMVYIFQGYILFPYFTELRMVIGQTNTVLLLVGGALYTIGAIGYSFKWPRLNPKVFGYHELFHVYVNLAAIIHFIVIYSII